MVSSTGTNNPPFKMTERCKVCERKYECLTQGEELCYQDRIREQFEEAMRQYNQQRQEVQKQWNPPQPFYGQFPLPIGNPISPEELQRKEWERIRQRQQYEEELWRKPQILKDYESLNTNYGKLSQNWEDDTEKAE